MSPYYFIQAVLSLPNRKLTRGKRNLDHLPIFHCCFVSMIPFFRLPFLSIIFFFHSTIFPHPLPTFILSKYLGFEAESLLRPFAMNLETRRISRGRRRGKWDSPWWKAGFARENIMIGAHIPVGGPARKHFKCAVDIQSYRMKCINTTPSCSKFYRLWIILLNSIKCFPVGKRGTC